MANNSYEEARKQRLEDNMKRFQALGIPEISKSFSVTMKSETKSQHRQIKPESSRDIQFFELRRSSRAASNPAPSYSEIDSEFRYMRKRRKSMVSVRSARYEERVYAIECAEKFRANLKSGHPCFVKPMVRSHVSSCFWLGLPAKFCKENLPSRNLKMVLEDEDGVEYDSLYIGIRAGLSAGWKGFAMDHNLDDGDALIFELSEPERFKIYIFKASDYFSQANETTPTVSKEKITDQPSKAWKPIENGDEVASKLLKEIGSTKRAKRAAKRGRHKE